MERKEYSVSGQRQKQKRTTREGKMNNRFQTHREIVRHTERVGGRKETSGRER